MKLGSMQPYFFPYLGHFDVINCVDRWIVFDIAQNIRRGWVHRNRILHPVRGWQYIIVPRRKHPRETMIKDVRIANEQDWKQRIVGQLQHYKKKAPYFRETVEFVQTCLAFEGDSLSRLNTAILCKVCAYLGIRFDYSVFSEMALELGPVKEPDDWALRMSQALGAEEYVNSPGGVEIFDRQKYVREGIKLTIRKMHAFEYACGTRTFIPNLSIIDVLMWNEPTVVKDYLDRRKGVQCAP